MGSRNQAVSNELIYSGLVCFPETPHQHLHESIVDLRFGFLFLQCNQASAKDANSELFGWDCTRSNHDAYKLEQFEFSLWTAGTMECAKSRSRFVRQAVIQWT